jgi:hypothetical protein
MLAELSVSFLSFLVVFLANTARYSLRDGVFALPLASPYAREHQPRRFYLAVSTVALLSVVCLATISSYVWRFI